ncbi:hypothetical protein FJR11_20825 [Anabaena sp. UHCC 0187]|uniref:hypothetical protein n=1 Tax=Anabaena sp. UHCC 0187 TaxID=2590018 RepID=UPI001448102B|nr:hypothetical protein [Anabaena sp. UHCC 0187]MTJ14977.1 hypothetical protein [Anabaena sp. UHCC 0187]
MDRNTRISTIINNRHIWSEKISKVEKHLKTLSSTLEKLEEKRNYILKSTENLQIIGKLNEISFAHTQSNITAELDSLTKLRNRFSRPTLNIGVVGRARQGKSRLLQSLTGLTKAEIPDGDRQHCTGVKSIIHHNSNVDTYGEVWFHTERSFLDDIIAPYYEKLGLGRKPFTVEEFAKNPLLSLPQDIPGYAEPGAMYEHLKRYHTYFSHYSHLLKQNSPFKIQKHEIREYVAQDTPDGERNYFNFLAVKEVRITCSFPNVDVSQVALVDMPGLGDTGIGDETRLIKSLGNDIDFILFVRMPKSAGDYWADVDVRLYDISRSALIELPVNLWSFVILNQTSSDSKNGDNLNNCQDLLNTLQEKYITVEKCLIANCSQETETSKILDILIDYLTNNMTNLDKQYARSCQERLLEIYKAINSELNKAQDIFNQNYEDDYQEIEELFSDLFGNSDNGWWKEVSLALQELRTQLWHQRQTPNEELYNGFLAAIEKCERDKGILSSENAIEEIRNRIKGMSVFRAYPDYQDELRVLISHRFLSLDENLKQTVELMKSQVVKVLKEQGCLESISNNDGSEFFTDIANIIPERFPKLKAGFEILAEFRLSYRGLILPRIRQHLDGLTNISPMTGEFGGISQPQNQTIALTKDTTADEIFTALEIDYDIAINTIKPILEELMVEPNQALYAMVEEFIDNVIRQKDIQKEWKNFLRGVRGQIWEDIFGKKEHDRQMRKEWLESVNQVTSVNKLDLFDLAK